MSTPPSPVNAPPSPLRIVLVDDERMVRTALRAILSSEPDLQVVGEAGSGAEAVPVVRELRPDVVLMDVRMPDVDGIRATERILSTMADPPRVIVVTTFENDSYVYDALRAGASGFLLKRARAEDLVQAVRLVARSDSLLFPAAVRALAAEHAAARGPDREASARALSERLSEREAVVLRLMTDGLSNSEIATRMAVGPATVKTHVGAVLTKLGVRDRTQAVIAAYESGFVTPG
ncbi:response regulator [Streptomyces antimycoticus]|uniref:Response regulator transcription factor n=3 Tax=Streptomyces TaxID=1883 RepID=A0ABD5JAT3_9ACTN|nr:MULTISPECIES: response regulator transcription factor [Streptomyces]MEE4585502.1 response regulator transcription factor [Streptomyces sp. DSM 41602]KUL57840.1 LuxR family transcriptional regulator [Streptomyces violaceusniger]QTI88402.1 response regulator transcription factor [Streptomyces sp. AgN23]RSS36825.1 DNA-binding response regulator [Streptomyces sp. WAC05858]WJE00339.1 response regulator transcription factor [Streptomyces antimycoticus]